MVRETFKNCLIFVSIGVLFFLFSLEQTSAQPSFTVGGQTAGVTLSVSPENPKPDEDITFSLASYSNNLDSSTIHWYIDDVLKQEGVGVKSFNTRVGKSGDILSVSADVFTSDGKQFTQSLSVNPSNVDIIVEAGSYVPPLYKGRAYFASQGTAKLISIPDIVRNGKRLEAKDLVFKWKQGIISLGNLSGLGRNTLIVEGSVPIKDIDIELQVLDSSGKVVARKSTIINPNISKILFYEDSSLYGVLLNKAIPSNYNIGGKEEVKIVAKPYFFDFVSIGANDSKYSWSVNGKSITLGGPKNEILLRQDGKVGGSASVSLKIENQARIFQFAENNFNITFGN